MVAGEGDRVEKIPESGGDCGTRGRDAKERAGARLAPMALR
jgi:hypothetical protein